MNLFKIIKRRWMNYLKRLEKANEKMYGSRRLDCCDLNKENGKS